MYLTCFNNLQQPSKKPAKAFGFPAKRLSEYKSQNTDAKCEFSLTLKHFDMQLWQQKYLCGLCCKQLTSNIASADRINSKLMPCVARRSSGYLYRPVLQNKFKLLEFNSDRLVYSIGKEAKDIYSRMKANIAGGPSIIFNRYAKRNEIKICGGKLRKKIIGHDANTLYMWGLVMRCLMIACHHQLTTIKAYLDIVDDIVTDKIFGFLECDIRIQIT
ncbi:Hypothetical protein PHPALM_36800 [Phytophthora palmivora]|uniref:Uncharacterized protein n=1 Tax=Phytophthora palmivora TaxID=4796 RepID=A0A2P4WZ12_9STRA|nr:Hypothetical protein PHPALM_36800 [Phytophthora palmivora]